jgi:Domain of unknown function (DUF1992)
MDQLIEDKIQRAIAVGELRNSPGEGRPLCLDDDLLVPEEMRPALRILKNSGFVPAEILWRKEAAQLAASLADPSDGGELKRGLTRLALLRVALAQSGHSRSSIPQQYLRRAAEKLSR